MKLYLCKDCTNCLKHWIFIQKELSTTRSRHSLYNLFTLRPTLNFFCVLAVWQELLSPCGNSNKQSMILIQELFIINSLFSIIFDDNCFRREKNSLFVFLLFSSQDPSHIFRRNNTCWRKHAYIQICINGSAFRSRTVE